MFLTANHVLQVAISLRYILHLSQQCYDLAPDQCCATLPQYDTLESACWTTMSGLAVGDIASF